MLPCQERHYASQWRKRMGGADLDAVIAAGRAHLAEGPLSRGELDALLAASASPAPRRARWRWPRRCISRACRSRRAASGASARCRGSPMREPAGAASVGDDRPPLPRRLRAGDRRRHPHLVRAHRPARRRRRARPRRARRRPARRPGRAVARPGHPGAAALPARVRQRPARPRRPLAHRPAARSRCRAGGTRGTVLVDGFVAGAWVFADGEVRTDVEGDGVAAEADALSAFLRAP